MKPASFNFAAVKPLSLRSAALQPALFSFFDVLKPTSLSCFMVKPASLSCGVKACVTPPYPPKLIECDCIYNGMIFWVGWGNWDEDWGAEG